MSDDTPKPDYSELLSSPYDPEPDYSEGDSAIPWRPPVIAAILGALAVATFTVYAIVTGPASEQEADETVSTVVVASAPEKSDGLPPGYTPIAQDVGVRVEAVTTSPRATTFAVSSAVAGSADPSEVSPVDVAYWEIEGVGGVVPMVRQYGGAAAIPGDPRHGASGISTSPTGNLTVEFPPDVTLTDARLLAYVADGVIERSKSIELPADTASEVTDVRIDMGAGTVVVIESLIVGDGWGHVTWRVDGGATARLDAIVSFVGTSGSVVEHPHGTLPLEGPFTYRGSDRLANWESASSENTLAPAIVVEFRVAVPERVSDPIVLELPAEG
ncbi:MAG: hypothetical protein BMS9Abin20_1059 [Acidimicrobiia bacterium]|nr:MAG: hypothetical protein BMS9Abin20_1059 [Acidimicrobiia bacterium]